LGIHAKWLDDALAIDALWNVTLVRGHARFVSVTVAEDTARLALTSFTNVVYQEKQI